MEGERRNVASETPEHMRQPARGGSMNRSQIRSVIVTGGASGIGQAVVERLASDGCALTIGDINAEAGERLAAALKDAGVAAVQFVRADMSEEASVAGLVDAAVEAFGRLDGAVNAAGLPPSRKTLHELERAEWARNLEVNLSGMFYCLKHQIAAMLRNDSGGAIVAVSSASALKGMPQTAEYSASKAGVTGLVRAAAVDYAQHRIRINALLPGATNTPLVALARARNPDVPPMGVPMGRMAEPAEIAAMAAWLVSDEASYVTGQCMTVDGGMTIS
jgi:NAD(P)-dependent dehydrogenase (short-subunit alcohol dehydrogenase family)